MSLDTVNGMPIQAWLNEHEVISQEDRKIIKEAREPHFLYKRQPVMKHIVRGRSGKARSLTRQEIFKIYGRKPMSNLDKLVKKMAQNMKEGKSYKAADIYRWVSSIGTKSFGALMSALYTPLSDAGYLSREGEPFEYEFTAAYYQYKPADNELIKIIKARKREYEALRRHRLLTTEQKKLSSSISEPPVASAIPTDLNINVTLTVKFMIGDH